MSLAHVDVTAGVDVAKKSTDNCHDKAIPDGWKEKGRYGDQVFDDIENMKTVVVMGSLDERKVEDDAMCYGKRSQPPEVETTAKADVNGGVNDEAPNVLLKRSDVDPDHEKLKEKYPQKRSLLVGMLIVFIS